MNRWLRRFSIKGSQPNPAWLILLLWVAVLVPSVCLLWFMNQAVRNERLALRQQLMDSYREQLTMAQGRLDQFWDATARALRAGSLAPAARFASATAAGMADGIIIRDHTGQTIYPAQGGAPSRSDTNSIAAQTLQAQIRALTATGRKNDALALIQDPLSSPRFARSVDPEGRWIVPNAELLALENGGGSREMVERLRSQLLDYGNGLPSAQRRFLMRRFERLYPSTVFPTLAAEDVTADFLESRSSNICPVTLGNDVLLFHKASLANRLRTVLGANATLLPPGAIASASPLALPAGPRLPGWQLVPAGADRHLFDDAARAQVVSYWWTGVLALTAMAALTFVAAHYLRRQMAVAELRNDLVANVTHELKTPLSSMRLLVDTLLQAPTLQEQTVRQYLQLIAGENLRLSRLIDNFLAFSRLDRDQHRFDFIQTTPQAIIETAAAAVRERFQAAGCGFETQSETNLPMVSADSGAMATALINLLDNAFKYSGDDKKIRMCARAGDGCVTFAVQDNGIGLAPREQHRIFRRFYQVDQRMARSAGGCGLGLSIVQYIVRAHRGDVRVESQPGRGSTFFITLPALVAP